MKKVLLFTLLIGLSFNVVYSQCNENDQTKVLLVGDSWAFFMGLDQTINNVFDDWGFSNYTFYTDPSLAVNGAETSDFLTAQKQALIANKLNSTPSIKYVHLSIGGNDVLGDWKSQSFTQAQTDSLVTQVEDSVEAVISFIKSVRPDITVVYSGYAYPNFEEVIQSFLIPTQHPFYGTWDDMEQPTNAEINALLNRFSQDISDYYANDPRVAYVMATGIAQYAVGQTDPLGVAPYGTYPPHSVPLPLGKPDYPTPMDAMRDYGVTKDCFHLSKDGFEALIGYTTQKFYHYALMDDKYILADDSLLNGSVSQSGNTSNKLFVGNNSGEKYSTILTFNTLNNLDSTVDKASIFLHRVKHTGSGNPIDGTLTISVNNGDFGSVASIEPTDYSATGNANGNPCAFGTNTDGNWVRLDLPQNLLTYIKNNNITQFKISATDSVTSRVEFSGTAKPDFAPVLNIVYGNQSFAGVKNENIAPEVLVYPNPSHNYLNVRIDYAKINNIQISTIDGKKILETKSKKIDISQLPKGTYLIKILTNKGMVIQKFIKE